MSAEDIERLLQDDFGEKLHPVDDAKMAAQRRQRARQNEKQHCSGAPDDKVT